MKKVKVYFEDKLVKEFSGRIIIEPFFNHNTYYIKNDEDIVLALVPFNYLIVIE